MLDIFSRYRQMTLLAGVVLMQVLLLAFQIKRAHDVRLVRYWTAEVFTPFERAGNWSLSEIGGVWHGYLGLHGAHTENVRLQSEIDQLQLQNRELQTQAAEADRLAALLNFREAHTEVAMLAAQVIGGSADDTSHTMIINRGERDHVRRNCGVITPAGVVGKIIEVFPATSQVLLLDDKDSGVGALLADTRTHGVVKGIGDPQPHLDYVVNDEKVHPGEQILTSGDDRIFPKGLAIGTVMDAKPGTPFQIIRVQTAARLDRLEDVIVLLSQEQLAPTAAGNDLSGAIPVSTNSAPTVQGATATAPAVAGTSDTTGGPAGANPSQPPAQTSPEHH